MLRESYLRGLNTEGLEDLYVLMEVALDGQDANPFHRLIAPFLKALIVGKLAYFKTRHRLAKTG